MDINDIIELLPGFFVFLFLGFVFCWLLIVFVLPFVFERYIKRLLGPINFSISSPVIRMSEELKFSLTFSPRRKVTLQSVQVILHGYEWIEWTESETTTTTTTTGGMGDVRTTSTATSVTKNDTHTLHRRTSDLVINLVVQAGEVIEHTGSFTIPQEGPPTITASDNKIIWELIVKIDIKGLPDFQEEHSLSVLPVILQSS